MNTSTQSKSRSQTDAANEMPQDGNSPTDKSLDRASAIAQATKSIVDNKVWILTTVDSDNVIRSRPMLNINDNFKGQVYLFVRHDDELIQQLQDHPQVNLIISEPGQQSYASINGQAKITQDRQKGELMWNQQCEDWFELEKPDDQTILVNVDVEEIETWAAHESITTRIGKMLHLTTGNLHSDQVDHEKVAWSKKTENLLDSETKGQPSDQNG